MRPCLIWAPLHKTKQPTPFVGHEYGEQFY